LCSFFFQAEDGIRAGHVTGVQTCALPIYLAMTGEITLRGRVLPIGGAHGAQHLFFYATDRQHATPERDLTGHREIVTRRSPRQEIGRASCRESVEIAAADCCRAINVQELV